MSQRLNNWRAATLQGIGVLVGILIAFGVDAAWDERGDRERERIYLNALREELAQNSSGAEDFARFLETESKETREDLLEVPLARTPVSADAINRVVQRVGPISAG